MGSSIRWGLLTGFILSVWLIGGFSFFSSLPLKISQAVIRTLTGSLGLIILFIGVFYGMKAAKAQVPGKRFTHFMAFTSGLTVAVIVALVVSLASFLYIKFINPKFTEDMVMEARASLKASGATPQEMAEKLVKVRKEFSLLAQVIAPLIVQTVAGSIFSFILAFFLKNKKQ